ncbi:MAG: hypothetical protein ABIT37_00950 [Luteolibacter sp.]
MTRRAFIATSIAAVWLLTPLILGLIVKRNAENGVYGSSDAILIPIFGAVYFCAIGLPYLIFFAWSAMNRCSCALKPWEFTSSIRQWLILVIFVFGAFVLSLQIMSWLDWDHIPIAACYTLSLAWLVWIRPYASQKKSPNKARMATPTSPSVLDDLT